MPELTTQFDAALTKIEPTTADKDNAPQAHHRSVTPWLPTH